jgi:predicted DNA binding CopG/RHH family protein
MCGQVNGRVLKTTPLLRPIPTGENMNKKIKYTNEPMNIKKVEDFLPKPENLVLKEENVKVTLNLSRHSVDFFKKYAKKHNTHYQNMIKKLVDIYVNKFDM